MRAQCKSTTVWQHTTMVSSVFSFSAKETPGCRGCRPSIRQAQTDPRTAAPGGPFAGDLVPDLSVFSEFVTTLTDAKQEREIDQKIKIGPD